MKDCYFDFTLYILALTINFFLDYEMRYLFFTLLINITFLQLCGQNQTSFTSPLDLPLYLSGNFGEIRSDHFHSGIDLKTNGSIGHPVFSIEEGYISRIKVQANGYGNSLYITHSNGYTSVYGHLNNFRADIAEYVKEVQYRRKSHGVDIFPEKTLFPIQKGEQIANSGNTGGSTGPHLHFEIRKTAGQIPTNVLKFGFPIEDIKAPEFFKLFIYPRSTQSSVNLENSKVQYQVSRSNGSFKIKDDKIPMVYGDIGIGTEVFDFLNGAHNRCGVYTLELYMDQMLIYKHKIDEVPFSATRYINAHIDYEERVTSKVKSHKLFKLPNNQLKIYEHLENNGIITIKDSGIHEIKIIAADVAGNKSELNFSIRGNPAGAEKESIPADYIKQMPYNVENIFSDQGVEIVIPAYALYEDMNFNFEKKEGFDGLYSDIYTIQSKEFPVHKSYQLSIRPENLEEELYEKAIIVEIDDNANITSAGGEYINGKIVTSPRTFGSFSVAVDTVAPEVVLINGNASTDFSQKSSVKFIIQDTLSGISKYDGYIDNKWVLFEYDLKNNLITYSFDEERLEKGSEHELELYISDAKGNVSLFHTAFSW